VSDRPSRVHSEKSLIECHSEEFRRRRTTKNLEILRFTQDDTTAFFRMESNIKWKERQENKNKVAGAYLTPATRNQ